MTKSLFLLSFLRSMKCMFPSCRPLQDGEACLGGFSRKKQWVSPHYSCKRHTFSSASSEFQKKTIKRDVLEGQESFLSIFRNGTQSSFPFAKRRPRFTRVTRGVFVVFFVFLLGKSNEQKRRRKEKELCVAKIKLFDSLCGNFISMVCQQREHAKSSLLFLSLSLSLSLSNQKNKGFFLS